MLNVARLEFGPRGAMLWLILLWLAVAMLGSAAPCFAVGEPVNGFPNWYERMVHVLTNRARCDPDAALVGCDPCGDVDLGCYEPVAPVQWDANLNRAARFHSLNLRDSGCGMLHNSPCTLESDIGTTFPDACDGSVSCACVGGTASCFGTGNWDRLGLFGITTGYRGENIVAYLADPFMAFDLWLLESMTTETCDFHCSAYDNCNGHRMNILNADFTRLGVGSSVGGVTVQDFWGGGDVDQKIPSACHFPQNGGAGTEFRVNWYDSAAPGQAWVNIDGACFAMALERGTGNNGTYLYTTAITDSVRYYFEFRDAGNVLVTYPETGSFGIGCSDWNPNRLDSCGAASVGDPLPQAAALAQNFPNPFNPQTTIAFDLPGPMSVSLRIFDGSGRLMDILLEDEVAAAGRNEVVWNGRDSGGRRLSSGTYFYRLEAGGASETRRMTLLK